MSTWSILIGTVGVIGTGALVARYRSRSPQWSPERYWLLGMAALFPAWLIAFLGLLDLGPVQGSEEPLFILSSALPLLGVIATDAVVRRLRGSGRLYQSLTYWLLGIGAILPGWGLALFFQSTIFSSK